MKMEVFTGSMDSKAFGDVEASLQLVKTIANDSDRAEADAYLMADILRKGRVWIYTSPMSIADMEEAEKEKGATAPQEEEKDD